MKRAMCMMLASLAISLPASVTWGQYESGNRLWEHLSVTEDDPTYWQKKSQAFGYIMGIADALNLYGEIVFPKGTTNRQVADVASRYLEQHPESRHKPSVVLVREALVKAFPAEQTSQ